MNEARRPGRRPVRELTEPQIRTLRKIRSLTARRGFPPSIQELAMALGITPASTHDQVNQLVRKSYLRREPRKARGLTVLRCPDSDVSDVVAVPVIGTVAAGKPIYAEENRMGEVLVEADVVRDRRCFALKVRGDSMVKAGIRNGDLVVVRQQPVAESGDIVVALLDNHATVKRLHIAEDRIELLPEHPRYRPIPVGPDDDLKIVGKVVAIRRTGTK